MCKKCGEYLTGKPIEITTTAQEHFCEDFNNSISKFIECKAIIERAQTSYQARSPMSTILISSPPAVPMPPPPPPLPPMPLALRNEQQSIKSTLKPHAQKRTSQSQTELFDELAKAIKYALPFYYDLTICIFILFSFFVIRKRSTKSYDASGEPIEFKPFAQCP